MKWKFCVFTVSTDFVISTKRFTNYNEAIHYAFHCEDDLNIKHVEIRIITKGDYIYE